MNYDYRHGNGPMRGPPAAPSFHPQAPPPPGRYGPPPAVAGYGPRPVATVPYAQQSVPPAPPSPEVGIRVAIKLEHQITPPPMMPQMQDISRSTFQFDFDLEKRILKEAEKWDMKWNEDEIWSDAVEDNHSPKSLSSPSTAGPIAGGGEECGHEVMSLAVLNYGNNSEKVLKFVEGHKLLVEMGFASKPVTDALLMYDNDTDKASAHLLDSSS